MSERLGIVFLHHHADRVVLNNLRSVRVQNPDATVVTISADEALQGGYSLNATPKLKRLHSTLINKSSDRLVCSWFLQRKEKCDKWWITEWDAFCATSVRDYYRPVWDFPFVSSSVRLPYREPEWGWFEHIETMPEEYQPFAMGIVPSLCLISEAALAATCTMLMEKPMTIGNAEIRFATAANRCGFAPCGYSPPNDQITWEVLPSVTKQPTIFHSVKHYVEF